MKRLRATAGKWRYVALQVGRAWRVYDQCVVVARVEALIGVAAVRRGRPWRIVRTEPGEPIATLGSSYASPAAAMAAFDAREVEYQAIARLRAYASGRRADPTRRDDRRADEQTSGAPPSCVQK